MSDHQENKKVRFQEDFVEMETSPTTSSTEFSEISKISESLVFAQTECKFYFFDFLYNKIMVICTKVQKITPYTPK